MPSSESPISKRVESAGIPDAGKVLYFAHYNSSLNFRHYYEAGNCLRGQGKTAEAIEAWETALELNPNNVDAHLDLGSLLAESGDIEGALNHFQAAARLEPSNIDANYFLGLAYFRLENYKTALKYWKHCFTCKTEGIDEITLRMCLAEAYRALGRFQKAIYQLEQILNSSPHNLDAYNVLAMVLFEMDQKSLAMEVLQQALACAPNFYRTHLNLGVLYFDRGAIDMAIHEFK